MATTFTHDVVILGAGSAGIAAVEGARAAGAKKIAIVEPGHLGGECPFDACVPTKTMLASARRFYQLTHDGERFGVRTKGARFDWAQAVARKDAVVQAITGGGKKISAFLKSVDVEHIRAKGLLVDAHTVQAGSVRLKARAVIIAAGAEDIVPDVHGLADVPYETYASLLKRKYPPKSVAILGGGAVACELATLCAYLGIPVAMFEAAPSVLPREDVEAGLLAAESLRHMGVDVHVGATVMSAQPTRGGVKLVYGVGHAARRTHEAETLIVAVGKRSRLRAVGADVAGVALDHRGDAALGTDMRTNVKHVFVAGDATAGLRFTNTAHLGGYVAGWNAARVGKRGQQRQADFSIVPRVIFTHPELAAVGPSLEELRDAHQDLRIFRAPLSVLSRAACDGQRFGFLKVITDAHGNILSAVGIGERLGEVLHEIATAMRHNVSLFELMHALRAFPSYSEIIGLLEER